jgi:primosomal protein N' (replication factor Y)
MEKELKPYLKVVFPNGRSSLYRLEEKINFNPVGYRVLVPLPSSGKGATAIVVKSLFMPFDSSLPMVDSFPDSHPVINPLAVELLKNHLLEHLTTLGEALFKLIPSELDWYQETFVVATDKNPVGLPPSLKEVFELLRKKGKMELEKLTKKVDKKLIQLLKEKHLIKIETRWVAPKFEEYRYRLVLKPSLAWEKLKKIRSQKRLEEIKKLFELLETFIEVSQDEIKEAGVSSATLRLLEKKGIIEKVVYTVADIKPSALLRQGVLKAQEPPRRGLFENLKTNQRLEKALSFSEWALKNSKDVLIVVPTLELLKVYHQRFMEIFGDRVVVFNDNLPTKERLKNWFYPANKGFPKIFLTTPKWIFAPISNLGLIIAEDESSPFYKLQRHPYFNMKKLIFELAKYTRSALVLFSQPPSVEIYLKRNHFEVEEEKNFPKVEVYEGKNPLKDNGFISRLRSLEGETLVLVPKKGYSNLYCSRCQVFIECPRCEVFLTLTEDRQIAQCPLCGYKTQPKECPHCGSPLKREGFGVERVKEVVSFYLPEERAFYGTSPNLFWDKEFDNVLILFADTLLSSPDFRRREEFLDYLTKAALLLKNPSEGLFFVHSNHMEEDIIKALQGQKEEFYKNELQMRELLQLPPFSWLYLVAINLKEDKEDLAKEIYREIKTALLPFKEIEVLYSKAPIFKLREKYRYQVLVKIPAKVDREIFKKALKVLKEIRNRYKYVRVIPNPRSFL